MQAAGAREILAPSQQVDYNASALGKPTVVDPVLTTSWRQGWLVFRDAPFETIVAEVNRYRSGRIMIIRPELAQRRYNAMFKLDEINGIVGHLQRLSHASATTLGNLTLLSWVVAVITWRPASVPV